MRPIASHRDLPTAGHDSTRGDLAEAATLDWLERGGDDRKAFLGAARRSLLVAKNGNQFLQPRG